MFLIDKVNYLAIGVQGENIATDVEFDMSTWDNQHPGANYHILFKPYNEQYPSPMTSEYDAETHVLTWHVSLAATAIVGVGYTEVRAIDPDTGLIKKTRIIPTSVENSVSGVESDEIPPPYTDWVNQVLAASDSANYDALYAGTKARDAEAWATGKRNGIPVPTSDDTYRNNSKWYKEQAEMAAIDSGFFYVGIDGNGHLIYTRVDTLDDLVDFELDEGRLILWLERE